MLKQVRKAFLVLILILATWISYDLWVSHPSDQRDFDPVQMGQLETAMWRSYYEQKPVQLFSQLTRTMRTQFGAPFWKSVQLAFFASKAAFTFQKGSDRPEYEQALPYLESYYQGIQDLSTRPFQVKQAAKDELEWWVIRREREIHPPSDWEVLIAQIAASLYKMEAKQFEAYAHLRVKAMLIRDELGENITDQEWAEIEDILKESWTELHIAVQ